jgi:hypothetical protein
MLVGKTAKTSGMDAQTGLDVADNNLTDMATNGATGYSLGM